MNPLFRLRWSHRLNPVIWKIPLPSVVRFGCKPVGPFVCHSVRCYRIRLPNGEVPEQIKELTEKLFQGDRRSLSRSITLLESTNPLRRQEGQYILSQAMNYLHEQEKSSGRYTLRIGLSGPPGAGKSTFIESLGSRLTGTTPWLTDQEETTTEPDERKKKAKPVPIPTDKHRVAVLAIDPSSYATGGSLLADKTRMFELSRDPNAYIRPTPSGGNLGGVARSTNETVLLCEASGYDLVLVETVGVGQSETAVADMVDLFVLIIPPAGGDEYQGIKRGIVEYADIVLVNKADGDLLAPAHRIAIEYNSALKYQRRRRPNWRPEVMLVSSYMGTGLPAFWNRVLEFKAQHIATNELQSIRKKQMKVWMWNYIKEGVWDQFRAHPKIRLELAEIERQVEAGEMAPGPAAEQLVQLFSQTP
ncbi:Methylmalonyl Co-A mutase-associated GTPase MeaB [Paragonimus heterotremus]|uniref:Methylmalonyl Co-A mutase-associated GTPase MeaB n=1 Tax=Paragonimus heterotremus TaxID=100268 RepID=A0A8J4T4Q8_9TREM|nr:Methylmalonyl Co-A mutase-associated GTPase MeaB [Paragonimus heterotremus]